MIYRWATGIKNYYLKRIGGVIRKRFAISSNYLTFYGTVSYRIVLFCMYCTVLNGLANNAYRIVSYRIVLNGLFRI